MEFNHGKNKISYLTVITLLIIVATLFLGIGYAQISTFLSFSGTANASPPAYDVYISLIEPNISGGVEIKNYVSTVISASVSSSTTQSFNVTIKNQSADKTYVFERVLTGQEANIEGVYSGQDITYNLSDLVSLDELAPNSSLTCKIDIITKNGATTNNYVLKLNFIEKTGTEILPGNPDEPDTPVDPDNPDPPIIDPDEPVTPGDELHDDFLGLVEALLSTNTNCLNDSDVIYNAVRATISMNRPSGHPPIVHCQVKCIPGGNMSNVTENANSNLKSHLSFIFEADETNENRMFLYMYYTENCTEDKIGQTILTYRQIVTRQSDGTWIADGTYKGEATIDEIFGGGNNGKSVLTINPYTWVYDNRIR